MTPSLLSRVKAEFHYAIWSQTGPKSQTNLVADLQRAGIWPII